MDITYALTRILQLIFCIVGAGAYLAWRWKRTSDVHDAELAQQRLARQSFEQLKHDPRFHHLLQYIQSKYRTTFDRPSDPTTYRVRYATLMNELYSPLLAHEVAGARFLVAYLERKDKPTRIQATLDLRSGACGDAEMGLLGSGTVDAYIGHEA